MPIDWKSQESYQRLLAALVAASDNAIDFKKVAYYFGQGATYDSIEGRFRIAKRMANDLKKEAEDEGRQMPTTRTKSANSTPRKPKAKPNTEHSVASGRVQKSPSKKRGTKSTPSFKQEPQTPISLDSDDHESGVQQHPQHHQHRQQPSYDSGAFEHSSSYIYGDSQTLFHSFDTDALEA
ncbi:splicing arginine serine-rich 2 [Diplodia corticola]|uniref:Splicing arginine serine-rich 2 n=1 Tax=Diplodia corticola TaxID=236234 RepID=A0A1J9RQT3_9PEZI|nr:splicing arginine serine-rich 2 [Diplodia corticola]OJD29909.1 splicing arginine serine-rich 2 [Diplodia corticola]